MAMRKIVTDHPKTQHEKLMNTARSFGGDIDIVLNDKKRISLIELADRCTETCQERKSGNTRCCGECADADSECVMAILMRIALQAANLRDLFADVENQGDG